MSLKWTQRLRQVSSKGPTSTMSLTKAAVPGTKCHALKQVEKNFLIPLVGLTALSTASDRYPYPPPIYEQGKDDAFTVAGFQARNVHSLTSDARSEVQDMLSNIVVQKKADVLAEVNADETKTSW